ncbi:MAG: DMT family transporter [Candidatus Marinimicrobia bacterium]|nr:DMT family transporter [Candidatus Neomarinimicrobiota bacterium]
MNFLNSSRFALIGLVIATMVWGFTFTIVKSALCDAPPFGFLAWRFLLATIMGGVILGRRFCTISKVEIFGGIICGIFLFSGFSFQTLGLVTTTASKSAFITSISIIMVPVILILVKVQHVRPKIWISMLMAIAGLYFVLNPSGSGITQGDILTFGCAISFAIHIIFQDRYSKQRVDTFRFFVIQAAVVSILSFGNHFIFESQPIIWSTHLITALIITALAATLFGFGMMIQAQKVLSPSRTAIVLSLEPLFATLFAILVSGEIFTPMGWVGGGLVIAGVILAESGEIA